MSLLRETTRLPCNHYFCRYRVSTFHFMARECIEYYVNNGHRCPVCKSEFDAHCLQSAPSMDRIVRDYRVLLESPDDALTVHFLVPTDC